MKAKEYIIKDCKDPETGKCPTWGEIEKHISYDIYGTERLMEDYHQSKLKEIMPTDEEIEKQFLIPGLKPSGITAMDICLSEEISRIKGAREGAKWFKSEIEKRNK